MTDPEAALFGLFSKTVAVTFVDVTTGKIIASSDMPLDQLPDSFDVDTTLDMAGTSYVVIGAEPMTKAEFSRKKRLRVELKRAEFLHPKDILFSLPTICGGALPNTSAVASHGDVLVLHEDDFRQCEFVSSQHQDEISAELSDIQRIHSEQYASVGFRKLHVRERIPQPLPAGIPWSRVCGLLGDHVSALGGVSIARREHAAMGAVGVRFQDGVALWGVQENGALTALCVERLDAASWATLETLKRVADELSCALIHWCRCQVHCRTVMIEHATRL